MPRPAPSPTAAPRAPDPAGRPAPGRAWIVPASLAAAVLIAVSFGAADPLGARLGTLAAAWIFSGWTPAAYLLGAIGWGTLARPWTRPLDPSGALDAALGLAVTLSVTHLLGAFGLLGPVTAWLWTGVGGLLLVRALVTSRPRVRCTATAQRVATALATAGLAVMLVAAASPPGALWNSEFGAYDALSYHLQLPAEWLERGRITPPEHNVYAFLPGYLEAATVHLAHLAGASPLDADGLSALTGDLAMAPHFLALGVTLLGAWTTGALGAALARRITPDRPETALTAGIAAGAIVLLTPWAQVTGSIAYNEPGVIALGAAGLLAAFARDGTPVRRALLCAFLIGGAAGCKPTAVLFLAPACAIGLAMSAPVRAWPALFGVGAAVGLLTLAPWLARNAAYGGNPVFPHAVSLFGPAHWTPDQVARYAAAHRFDGSITERIAMLVAPASGTDAADAPVVRWRGLTNPQWALTPWVGLIGCLGAAVSARARPLGLALLAGIGTGLVAWMAFTHLQSRFLIPTLPLFAAGFACGLAVLPRPVHTPTVAAVLAGSALWSMANFASQSAGEPNALLVLGPGVYTGRLNVEGLGDQVAWAGVNETVPPGEPVLLVGDATPFYLRRPVVYATTWDAHPLAEAIRAAPGDPAAWTAALRARGLQWALISHAEIDRLARSGWADPALGPDAVNAWAASLGPPARAWPDQGRALYRLRSPAP